MPDGNHLSNQINPPQDSPEVLSLGELLKDEIPERASLLGDWLTERHRSMVYAPTGLGKSLFTFTLALAVASGGSVFGWDAPSPQKVLVVDGEMDIADIQERARVLLKTINGAETAAAERNLAIYARSKQAPDFPFPDIATPEGQEHLLRVITQHRPKLVILDNLSTLATLKDENDASAFDPVMLFLSRLSASGISVVLVHHARKNVNRFGGNFRGSSKIAATFESIIELKAIPGEAGGAFELTWEKFRSTPTGQIGSLKARLVSVDGKERWEVERGTLEKLNEMIRAWRSGQYPDQKALAADLKMSPSQLTKMKHRAFNQRLIDPKEWDEYKQDSKGRIDPFEDGDLLEEGELDDEDDGDEGGVE